MGKGDDEADRLVRMYLSFFSLYKVLTLAKSVNDGFFSSIVEAHPKDVARSIREYAAWGHISGTSSTLCSFSL